MSKQLRHRLETLKSERSKALNVKASLVLNKKEDTQEYRDLEANLVDINNNVELIDKMLAMPSYQAMEASGEIEARNEQTALQSRMIATSVTDNVVSAITSNKSAETRAKQDVAFRSYIRSGNLNTRDLATTSDAGGAAVIPQGYSFGAFAKKYYAPLANYLNWIETQGGQPYKISFLNATTTPGLVLIEEDATTSPFTEQDPVMSSNVVFTDLFSSGKINVSWQELTDADNLDALLTRIGAQRYGQGLEKVLTTGSDSSASPVATPNNPGLLSGIQSSLTFQTATIAGGIKYADFISTLQLLDPAYLRGPKAAVMMSEGTRLTLASQLDSTGRPVWNPDPRQPFDSILGVPIVVNNALAAPVAGAFVANSLPILVGDFGNFATVRTDGDIRVNISREARAEFFEALVTFSARVGSTICDKNAVAAIKIAAS